MNLFKLSVTLDIVTGELLSSELCNPGVGTHEEVNALAPHAAHAHLSSREREIVGRRLEQRYNALHAPPSHKSHNQRGIWKYRERLKSFSVLLSMTQAAPGRNTRNLGK